MGFLFKKKSKLFLFVTAIDQTVIARPNTKIDQKLWKNLPRFSSSELQRQTPLVNTPIFQHLQKVMEREKYSFVFGNRKIREELLEKIGMISLPACFWEELARLRKLGYFYHHTLAVAGMAGAFALNKQLPQDAFLKLIISILVHDIGITRLPQSILFSENLYSEDDVLIMKQHPIISSLLIRYYSNQQMSQVADIALYHHSPEQLDADKIDMGDDSSDYYCWIISNLDIFDALISNRPFRPAYNFESALIQLRQLNAKFNFPTEIVNWLQQSFNKTAGNAQTTHLLIPYKPSLESPQLN